MIHSVASVNALTEINSRSYDKIKVLHLAQKLVSPSIWTHAFKKELSDVGTISVIEHADELSESEVVAHIRQHQVVLTSWSSLRIPEAILNDPGELKYICHVNGSIRGLITEKFFSSGLLITNWGDSMPFEVAEGTLTLLLACLKNLRGQIEDKRSGQWSDNFKGPSLLGGSLRNLRIGLYGYGSIGRHSAELLRPFGAIISVYDPFVQEFPDYITQVDSLDALFSSADAISVHAGVNEITQRSVTAELLSKLPNHGIVVNTARGEIIDQDALFKELENGRLRAGLDVLNDPDEGDHLPSGHPARQWPNLILSAHAISINHWPHPMSSPDCPLQRFHETALLNLSRFKEGKKLNNQLCQRRFKSGVKVAV